MMRLGDTVRVYKKKDLDPSMEDLNKVIIDVLLDRAPEPKFDIMTLSTQEMVEKYNTTGKL